mgnify:CR=1 FL=1|jgi:hypothetical protein
MVIDITTYAYAHPGGDFLLSYNVGRDVSKFFFGSYALDGNHNNPAGRNNRWAHSNIARKVANRHCIGALVRTNTAVGTYKIDQSEVLDVNSFTKCFPMVCTTHRILPGVSNYYSELATLGKHYHLVAMPNGKKHRENLRVVRRHYTITNAMRKKFYNEII